MSCSPGEDVPIGRSSGDRNGTSVVFHVKRAGQSRTSSRTVAAGEPGHHCPCRRLPYQPTLTAPPPEAGCLFHLRQQGGARPGTKDVAARTDPTLRSAVELTSVVICLLFYAPTGGRFGNSKAAGKVRSCSASKSSWTAGSLQPPLPQVVAVGNSRTLTTTTAAA